MPNQSPISRYLLVGIALIMLGAALPDAELLLEQARHWRTERRSQRIERIVLQEPIPFR